MEVLHFNTKVDVIMGHLSDGSPYVGLAFCDRGTGEMHTYPFPPEEAKDFGKEIVRLSKKAKKMKKES